MLALLTRHGREPSTLHVEHLALEVARGANLTGVVVPVVAAQALAARGHLMGHSRPPHPTTRRPSGLFVWGDRCGLPRAHLCGSGRGGRFDVQRASWRGDPLGRWPATPPYYLGWGRGMAHERIEMIATGGVPDGRGRP